MTATSTKDQKANREDYFIGLLVKRKKKKKKKPEQ